MALAIGLVAPGWWLAGAAWVLAAALLILADAVLAPAARSVSLALDAPRAFGIGREAAGRITATFAGRAAAEVQVALGVSERMNVRPLEQSVRTRGGAAEAHVRLTPSRRGEAVFERLWARWRGPFGMAWIQRAEDPGTVAPITPDVQGVKDEALRLFTRDAAFGMKAQIETGEGSDFHALKDFQTGMDLRAIDWKQSARHGKLVGREYRTERNPHVILALDTGRLMCAPLAGLPRIDRAINAALLLAFVSLKMGDRVGLFAFDARPRIASGVTGGAQAFPLLQRLAAGIDYTTEETNFTLGLTTLSGRLDRRSLVVVFTDFADPTSAELMIENVARLLHIHLVMFVVFRDEELETLAAKAPLEADDVSRAVVAGALLKEREVVVTRLRRMGAHIVDAPAERMGAELVNRYLDAMRRELV